MYISGTVRTVCFPCIFVFYDKAPTEIYTLSLHDALPISALGGDLHFTRGQAFGSGGDGLRRHRPHRERETARERAEDRKSTRLNSSHANISYAVFCLKKKKATKRSIHTESNS